jgi:hypothetical protein
LPAGPYRIAVQDLDITTIRYNTPERFRSVLRCVSELRVAISEKRVKGEGGREKNNESCVAKLAVSLIAGPVSDFGNIRLVFF